jgi:hypothetical protein
LHVGHSLYIHEKVLPFLRRQQAPGSNFPRVCVKADTTAHLIARVRVTDFPRDRPKSPT